MLRFFVLLYWLLLSSWALAQQAPSAEDLDKRIEDINAALRASITAVCRRQKSANSVKPTRTP